jgi:hypothetical protein
MVAKGDKAAEKGGATNAAAAAAEAKKAVGAAC